MSSNEKIRRIDELGRIVIPKDLRNLLRVNSNDTVLMEYSDNRLIITKHSILKSEQEMAKYIADLIEKVFNEYCIITDSQEVIVGDKIEQKDIEQLFKSISGKQYLIFNEFIVYPIIINSDLFGLVFINNSEQNKTNMLSKLVNELFTNGFYN